MQFFHILYRKIQLFVDLFILFFVFILFCTSISYNILLLFTNPQAIPFDIGITIKPIPVRDNLIEIDVVAIKTIVSNDVNFVVNVCFFSNFF